VGAKLQIFAQQLSTLLMLRRSAGKALTLLTSVFVQRPSYVMRTVILAPNFLAELGEFDALIVHTREELIGPYSFQGGREASLDAGFFACVAWWTQACSQHSTGGTRSFSGLFGFSRKLGGAALSAVTSAVPRVNGFRRCQPACTTFSPVAS
jgi:hypothetical protein